MSGQINIVIEFIDKNIDKIQGTRQIADELQENYNSLRQKFKWEMGISLGKYLQQKKCGYAQELLKTNSEINYSIAKDLGYNSGQSFIRAFKRQTGATPKKYRSTIQEKMKESFSSSGTF